MFRGLSGFMGVYGGLSGCMEVYIGFILFVWGVYRRLWAFRLSNLSCLRGAEVGRFGLSAMADSTSRTTSNLRMVKVHIPFRDS